MPSIRPNSGFTVIELLVVIVLIAMIAGFGLFIGMDFYRAYAYRSERSVIISMLQKARSESMDNINQARHGVHFSSPLKYIVFQCSSATPQCADYSGADTAQDLTVNPGFNSTVAGIPLDVVFSQLDGQCVTCAAGPQTVTVTANGQSKT